VQAELRRRYNDHLPICRHQAQSADRPASQTVLPGALSQYAVYTSGQQQFISPVLFLSSDGSSTLPSTAVQLVTIAPSDPNFTECLGNLTNSGASVKQESKNVASKSKLSNGDAALDSLMNGACESNSVDGEVVSEAMSLLAAVDACAAPAVDIQNSVSGMSSVPASPVTKPTYNSRRRRSMSCFPRTSERALRALKRSTARHMSSDETLVKKAAAESDNLPLFLSSMTDE